MPRYRITALFGLPGSTKEYKAYVDRDANDATVAVAAAVSLNTAGLIQLIGSEEVILFSPANLGCISVQSIEESFESGSPVTRKSGNRRAPDGWSTSGS